MNKRYHIVAQKQILKPESNVNEVLISFGTCFSLQKFFRKHRVVFCRVLRPVFCQWQGVYFKLYETYYKQDAR